jgi:hypothetical protein
MKKKFPDAEKGDTYKGVKKFDGTNWYWIGGSPVSNQ